MTLLRFPMLLSGQHQAAGWLFEVAPKTARDEVKIPKNSRILQSFIRSTFGHIVLKDAEHSDPVERTMVLHPCITGL